MEPIDVGVCTDDNLAPAEVVQVKGREVLGPLVLNLDAAAQDAKQVGDDVALEDAAVIRFQAIEDFAPDRHDALELRVAAQLNAAHSGIALYNVELPAARIPRPAIHELLDSVGEVHAAGQLLLDVQAGLFRVLPGPLVNKDLLPNFLRIHGRLDEINFYLGPEELRHGVLDEAVVDGLLCLVLIRSLAGEIVGD